MFPQPKPAIVLVNMPFSAVASPAIGLTQLKGVIERAFPGRFEVGIHYLNHEFHRFLGDADFYSHVMSNFGFATGLGDWLFRQAAFPEAEDNAAEYLDACYPESAPFADEIRSAVARIRPRLDAFLDEAIGKFRLDRADLVGFTAIFSQTLPSLALARKLKQRHPGLTTVVGGSSVAGAAGMAIARHAEAIDYVFSGPALVSFPEFAGHWSAGDTAACERIDGVFSRSNRDKWPDAAGAADGIAIFGRAEDIDAAPELDYDSFLDSFENHFAGTGLEPRLLFETSRGCWWGEKSHCSFCGLNGAFLDYHSMSPDRAVAAIRSVLRYSDRCRFFASTDNIMPKDFIAEVVPRLNVPDGVAIQYEVRANLGDEEIAALASAGITVIQPGIESLASATLRLMKKGTTAFSNLRFLKACSRHEIFAGYSLLVFSPGETEETYERYLDFMPALAHLPPPLAVYPVEFVRYSPWFDRAEEAGVDLAPEPYYGLTWPWPPASIEQIAQKFRDRHADLEAMRHWLGLLNERVTWWRARWYNRDHRAQARLCLATDGHETAIYDSRAGDEVEYPLTPDQEKVLAALEQPRLLSTLNTFPGLEAIDTEAAVDFFRQKRLLFEEDGRVMSLVGG